MVGLGLKIFVAGFVFLCTAASAHATTLLFSEYSSDSTPASSLQATLDFQVYGSTLRIEVTNQSLENPFDIQHIYFNASNDVESLSLSGYASNPYWSLQDEGYEIYNPLFGAFDYSLWSYATSMPDELIHPGETGLFLLDIGCAAGAVCDVSDFTTTQSGGRVPAIASIRFVQLFGDVAFGATNTIMPVPEPGTAGLLALGLAGLAVNRQRRH